MKLIHRALPKWGFFGFVLSCVVCRWWTFYWSLQWLLGKRCCSISHHESHGPSPNRTWQWAPVERYRKEEPEVFQMTKQFLFNQKLKIYCSCIHTSIWRLSCLNHFFHEPPIRMIKLKSLCCLHFGFNKWNFYITHFSLLILLLIYTLNALYYFVICLIQVKYAIFN